MDEPPWEPWDREYSKPHPVWKGPPRSEVDIPAGARVLELGCGNGKALAALARSASAVVAVDISRAALRACGAAYLSRADLARADLLRLPFADGSFDAVAAFHVLEHISQADRPGAVEEIGRVLVPGGSAHVRAFSVRDLRCGKGQEVEEMTFRRGNGISYHYFTPGELGSLFGRFDRVELEEIDSVKRFDGKDHLRAEIAARFRK